MRTTTMRCLVAGLAGAVALTAWAVVAGCECEGTCLDGPGSTARAVSCASDGNCPEAALCVDGYCMPLCTADADCPAGRCVEGVCDFAPEPWVCAPGAECPAGAVCVGGACKSEPGCAPAPEVCNGIDDDCDGVIDEEGSCACPCSAGLTCCADVCRNLVSDPANCGACGSVCPAGERCADGVCTGGCVPAPELCSNGRDDDCDAAIDGEDSDCACVSPPSPEICNGRDDDCDGEVDEGFDCQQGAPGYCGTECGSIGMRTCESWCSWGSCVPPVEVCNGMDDDCDGVYDEEGDCCGEGGCCRSDADCPVGRDCIGGFCRACGPERCNGLDDDCDGPIDEGYECQQGATDTCTTRCGSIGMLTCDSTCSWTSCVPPVEVCNGRDDDCDGVIDEEVSCACPCLPGMTCCAGVCKNLAYDPANCGACGAVCPAGQRCVDGACRPSV